MAFPKDLKVVPFWGVDYNPEDKIGHNQQATTLEPLGS